MYKATLKNYIQGAFVRTYKSRQAIFNINIFQNDLNSITTANKLYILDFIFSTFCYLSFVEHFFTYLIFLNAIYKRC